MLVVGGGGERRVLRGQHHELRAKTRVEQDVVTQMLHRRPFARPEPELRVGVDPARQKEADVLTVCIPCDGVEAKTLIASILDAPPPGLLGTSDALDEIVIRQRLAHCRFRRQHRDDPNETRARA